MRSCNAASSSLLEARADPLDAEIKFLNRQLDNGESIDMDDYKSKYKRYNTLFERKRGVFPSGYLVGCGLMMQPWNAWTV
jgi:hypothetical protein